MPNFKVSFRKAHHLAAQKKPVPASSLLHDDATGSQDGQQTLMRVQVAVPGPFYGALDYLIPEELLCNDLLSRTNASTTAAMTSHATTENHATTGQRKKKEAASEKKTENTPSAATKLSIQYDHLPLKLGMRLLVPLGKRQVIGVITSLGQSHYQQRDKLRPIISLTEEETVLTSSMLELAKFGALFYQYPLGDVLMNFMPKHLRQGKAIPNASSKASRKTTSDTENTHPKKNKNQIEVSNQLNKKQENTSHEQQIELLKEDPHTANAEQQRAIDQLSAQNGFQVSLLWGITGSGKTEVYLQIMTDILLKNKQVLVLVPEISLTPQTLQRFESRFKVPIYVLHSRLSDKARAESWAAQHRQQQACIVIGTRSALFSPLKKLGLIIIDEEHDSSFKQFAGWRYHARDMAIVRAKYENIPLLLGSATPSLETIYNIKHLSWKRFNLSKRAGEAQQARWSIIDLKQKKLVDGLSDQLIQKIKVHLQKNTQVLVFLNRRGFAPMLRCIHCGWQAQCKNCDSSMTLHMQPKRLICHHCLATAPPLTLCPQCQQSELTSSGMGTERLEEALKKLFPKEKIIRIDRDTTSRKGELQKRLECAKNAEANILLGTQMLAKGHHFPKLSCVAVIDADSGLYNVDFRASEVLGQLLTQVAGRAGRENIQGEVVLQSYHPQHPLLNMLTKNNYPSFAEHLLQLRKEYQLPPYSFMTLIRADAKTLDIATYALASVKKICINKKKEIQNHAASATPQKKTEENESLIKILGPIPAPMERLGGRYRAQLLLQTTSRALQVNMLKGLGEKLQQLRCLRSCRWSIDVDPQDQY